MPRILTAVLALMASVFALAGLPHDASAQKRVAFVVGTDKYDNLDKSRQLQRAVNDARAVGAAFKALGFEVIAAENLTRGQFNSEWQKFLDKLKAGDTAAIYYAGHGVEIEGLNFLLPRDIPDIKFGRQEQIKRESLSVAEILLDLRGRNPEIALVILDACRDNPLIPDEMRSAGTRGGGLAPLKGEPPKGTFIMYSAGAGESALDRLPGNDPDRENSIFTRKLVPLLGTKGLALHDMARQLRVDVIELASTVPHAQRPAYYDGVVGKYCLAGCESAAEGPKRAEPSTEEQRISTAATTWEKLRSSTNLADLEGFAARYRDLYFAGLAKARIDELKKQPTVVAKSEADAAQQATKKKSEDEAVSKEEAERKRLALLQRGDERKQAESLAGQTGAGTIKIGILHSLSGTMAINEKTLKDVMLMLIEEQNKKGGVLGKKLEAVVVDPASNWPLFPVKARELISKQKVAAVFGCWTSVSRKSVLPVFKEMNSILFYPVQYEGEESERNVFYTGAAPNQQAIPAVEYLMKEEKVLRWVLAGTDYVYPRTTNKILEAYLKSKGVKPEDIMINYTPFGHSDWQTIVADIKKFGSAGKKTAVVSTINGDANVPFYKELGNQGIAAKDIPVVALSVGEEELVGIDTKPLLGHLAAWNYFQSIDTPINKEFIAKWKAFTKNDKRVTNDPMEAHVIGFDMWVKAVEKVKSTDADKVIDAPPGIKVPNLTGATSEMLANHHITKPVFIGEFKADGQFDVVWKTEGLVPGDAWSKELVGSKDLIGDWTKAKCGNFNTKTNKCGG
jgi:urea transport system substrate-binding protein